MLFLQANIGRVSQTYHMSAVSCFTMFHQDNLMLVSGATNYDVFILHSKTQ